MSTIRVAAVAAPFGRDLDECFARIGRHVAAAREAGVDVLVLPEAAIGGYLATLHDPGSVQWPPALDPDGPEIRRLAALAGDMVLTAGFCEADGETRYNSAVAVTGDGVLGRHRKVHQPLNENLVYSAGSGYAAFDSPAGRMGMLICYDKAFPEAARTLALDGATLIACMSAWPASRTDPHPDLAQDRWTRRFDLYDAARALENQVVWASANQTGPFGQVQFVGRAKVVGPGGESLAETGVEGGMAMAEVDLSDALAAARRYMFHLRDRRPDSYRVGGDGTASAGNRAGRDGELVKDPA